MVETCLRILRSRKAPGDGFSERPGGPFRPDATAWAAIALCPGDPEWALVERIGEVLSAYQEGDGRVCLLPALSAVWWPTPLAVLAWQRSRKWKRSQALSISFLLSATGKHWKKSEGLSNGHDVSLRGWSWIEGTHSWVEPTSLAILALDAAGYGNHDRVREAVEMLLNRQLPRGGWNYGNTRVFDRELHPLPDCTGIALQALAGRITTDEVRSSLDYLKGTVPGIHAPFSLGWALLGLSAWGQRPRDAEALITKCLECNRAGDLPTSELCLLLLAFQAREGLGKWMSNQPQLGGRTEARG